MSLGSINFVLRFIQQTYYLTPQHEPQLEPINVERSFIENVSCLLPRHLQTHDTNHTVVYIEMAWFDLHSETFYSFIREICSCNTDKDPRWTVDAIPHFYIGPEGFMSPGLKEILIEYNDTTCGPIFFGIPGKKPNLTIVTTSYPGNFVSDEGDNQYRRLINDTRYIFICHEDSPSIEEDAANVFFLTPRHKRFILPSYFPPTKAQVHRRRQPEQPPIFLVLGAFLDSSKRNVPSLKHPLEKYHDLSFRLRFLGGAADATNETMLQKLKDIFPNNFDKIELFPKPATDEFMARVAEADVVMPLVDDEIFYGRYQSGKKLSSSVTWGLGFGKKMILYRPLAEVFGIQEDNVTYFLHGDLTSDPSAFSDAFGRCLHQLLRPADERSRQMIN